MKNKFYRPDSIKSQLSGIAVVFIIGTALAMGCVGIWLTHKFVKERFHDNFLVLSKYLARNAELGVLLKDRSMLEGLTRNLVQQKNILKVEIRDEGGQLIISTTQKDLDDEIRLKRRPRHPAASDKIPSDGVSYEEAPSGDTPSDEKGQTGSVSLNGNGVELDGAGVKLRADEVDSGSVCIVTPVFQIQPDMGDLALYALTPPQEVIGSVSLYYATAAMTAHTWNMTRFFLVIATLLSILSVVWYWYFARTITAPLMDLVTLSRKVSKGEFDNRAREGNLHETRALARGFNEMLDAIEAHQREMAQVHTEMANQKSLAEIGKFSMMVAHELKNPVAIIKGSLDIFKKETVDAATKQEMIFYVEDEVARLSRLIDEFLLFSKPKKPHFTDTAMGDFIGDVVEKFRFTASEKKITLTHCCDNVPLACDGGLMERALLNILKNAVDNTNESEVTIHVQGVHQGRHYLIRIEDDGPGIDPEIMGDIFNPFFTTRAKGTGLGLAIVRDIVTVHNGTVMVENRPSGGACFSMKLELEACPSFLPSGAD